MPRVPGAHVMAVRAPPGDSVGRAVSVSSNSRMVSRWCTTAAAAMVYDGSLSAHGFAA